MTEPLGVILAGGRSERLGGSQGIEKPLATVKSSPMVLHVARALAVAGVRKVVILAGENQHAIRHGLNMTSETGTLTADGRQIIDIEIRFSGNQAGTGGRLLALSDAELSASALVSYTDVLTDAPLRELVAQLHSTDAVLSMLAVNPPVPWGVLELEGTRVAAFDEKLTDPAQWINGGVFAVSPGIKTYISDSAEMLEIAPMTRMVAAAKVMATRHTGWWAAVDTYKDLRAINDCAKAGQHLSNGLSVR